MKPLLNNRSFWLGLVALAIMTADLGLLTRGGPPGISSTERRSGAGMTAADKAPSASPSPEVSPSGDPGNPPTSENATQGKATAGAGPKASVPQGIATDCSRDVTKELLAWIGSMPNGSTLSFAAKGCYRIDGTLRFEDRAGLVFEGNGATFKAGSEGNRDRRHFWFFGGANLVIRNLTVMGANSKAGTGDEAFRSDREFQHAFALQGVQAALLENVRASDVYGDFVYVGPDVGRGHKFQWSRKVIVQNSRFQRNGRQGIAVVAGEDVLISGNSLGQVRRATFDIEPTATHWGARNIQILNNTTTAGRLIWLASGGRSHDVGDIKIAGNVMKAATGTPIIKVVAPDDGSQPPLGARRGPFIIENNVFIVGGSPAAGIDCVRCVGLTIRNNQLTFPAERSMTAVSIKSTNTTRITGNTFKGAATILEADLYSTDYSESGNST
jgi:hypothetical protein